MSKNIINDYDASSIVGRASFTERQIQNLQFNAQRLRKDLTYVIPRQWVHDETTGINGGPVYSHKIFAVGYNGENEPEIVTTISINTLRARHLGKCSEGDLIINVAPSKEKGGLLRAINAPKQQSVFVSGSLPVKVEGKDAYIPRDFGFQIIGRECVYQLQVVEHAPGSGKWDVLTKKGTDIADLAVSTVNEYSECGVVSSDTSMISGFSEYALD